MEEQDWYEKDLSDFDDPQSSDEESDGKISYFLLLLEYLLFSSTTKYSIKTKSIIENNK